MSRTLSVALFCVAVIIAASAVALLVSAYTSHDHYHNVITPKAKEYEGSVHEWDHQFIANFHAKAPGAADVCKAGGEFRRRHKCAAVKHTKKDVCCWHDSEDNTGVLPHACCGVGWKEHNCERIIEQLCMQYDPAILSEGTRGWKEAEEARKRKEADL